MIPHSCKIALTDRIDISNSSEIYKLPLTSVSNDFRSTFKINFLKRKNDTRMEMSFGDTKQNYNKYQIKKGKSWLDASKVKLNG